MAAHDTTFTDLLTVIKKFSDAHYGEKPDEKKQLFSSEKDRLLKGVSEFRKFLHDLIESSKQLRTKVLNDLEVIFQEWVSVMQLADKYCLGIITWVKNLLDAFQIWKLAITSLSIDSWLKQLEIFGNDIPSLMKLSRDNGFISISDIAFSEGTKKIFLGLIDENTTPRGLKLTELTREKLSSTIHNLDFIAIKRENLIQDLTATLAQRVEEGSGFVKAMEEVEKKYTTLQKNLDEFGKAHKKVLDDEASKKLYIFLGTTAAVVVLFGAGIALLACGGAGIVELAAVIPLGVAILVPLGGAAIQLINTAKDYRKILATHEKLQTTISDASVHVEDQLREWKKLSETLTTIVSSLVDTHQFFKTNNQLELLEVALDTLTSPLKMVSSDFHDFHLDLQKELHDGIYKEFLSLKRAQLAPASPCSVS